MSEPEADEAASLALWLALEAALPAASVADEAASEAELLRPASSEEREEAAEPVAVDSADWMEEARLAAEPVMDSRADDSVSEAEDAMPEASEARDDVSESSDEETPVGRRLASVMVGPVVSWALNAESVSLGMKSGVDTGRRTTYQNHRGDSDEESGETHIGGGLGFGWCG